MEVLIVGTGGMARGIGLRLVRGGHQVRIASREPDKAADLAEDLGDSAVGEPLESAAGATRNCAPSTSAAESMLPRWRPSSCST